MRGRTRRRFRWLRAARRAVVWALLAWLGVTVTAVAALRWVRPPLTAVMVLEPGAFGEIDYRWVDRSRISAAAARAAIAAEDQKFLAHRGFDQEQINEAIETFRAGGRLRGASTISQQVAKNVFLWNGRSVARKGLEAYLTVLIEALLPKERILEIYLNVAEFGPGVFGVEAAARQYLDTGAAELGPADAALLAAVLPSPKRLHAADPSAYVRRRQAEIARQARLLADRGHYEGMVW